MVWHGKLDVPADGEYLFGLDSGGGSRLLIDNLQIAEIAEIVKPGPMGRRRRAKKAKVVLSKGLHPIRIEYFDSGGNKGISLNWSGSGVPGKQWLSDKPNVKATATVPVIDLLN
ncbi:PA14 domain-containing protein, partial [Rubritalea profundi]